MRRALSEYVVGGIRTTIPFFTWLLDQGDFVAGRFHTTYLDEILRARNGQPFVVPDEVEEDIAAIAAALQSASQPAQAPAGDAAASGQWKRRARAEGLR
jgi:acetyl-CoA carboxylase biotin carboxylase subunit